MARYPSRIEFNKTKLFIKALQEYISNETREIFCKLPANQINSTCQPTFNNLNAHENS